VNLSTFKDAVAENDGDRRFLVAISDRFVGTLLRDVSKP
jgi:hypothetical protein